MASDEQAVSGNIEIRGNVGAGAAVGHGAKVEASIIVGGDATIIITTQQPLTLKEDKLKFLCWVYVKANGSYFHRVTSEAIANQLNLTEVQIARTGQYLAAKDLIYFQTLAEGIKLTHKGVVVTEFALSEQGLLPGYFPQEVIEQLHTRKRSRYEFLRHLYEKAQGNPYELVLRVSVSDSLGIDDSQVVTTVMPYLSNEGWIRIRTNDSIVITEEGIEKIESNDFDSRL